MEHPTSKKHPRMSAEARAAQFSPFAALTGFEDELEETGRLTNEFVELTEDEKSRVDMKLQSIQERIKDCPTVAFTHFVKDKLKDGGEYRITRGQVKKIDLLERTVIMMDGPNIPIDLISDITV